jgi:Zn finger protein HypA/HybF involved in hydrogenase expression
VPTVLWLCAACGHTCDADHPPTFCPACKARVDLGSPGATVDVDATEAPGVGLTFSVAWSPEEDKE